MLDPVADIDFVANYNEYRKTHPVVLDTARIEKNMKDVQIYSMQKYGVSVQDAVSFLSENILK
jgi:hypothetical protein